MVQDHPDYQHMCVILSCDNPYIHSYFNKNIYKNTVSTNRIWFKCCMLKIIQQWLPLCTKYPVCSGTGTRSPSIKCIVKRISKIEHNKNIMEKKSHRDAAIDSMRHNSWGAQFKNKGPFAPFGDLQNRRLQTSAKQSPWLRGSGKISRRTGSSRQSLDYLFENQATL